LRRFEFAARAACARREAEPPALGQNLLLDEDDFSIEAAVFDHGLPCLGFALQERMRVNVWRDGLDRLGLPVGAWLNAAKRAVRRGDSDETSVPVGCERTITLGELKREALRIAPGQRVAYVVDAAASDDNVAS